MFSFFIQELNPDIDPRRITIRSGKSLIMKCPKCSHKYPCSPHILKGCKFCTHQQLCDDDSCNMCFVNSLASRHFKGIEEYKGFKMLLLGAAIDEIIYALFLKTCAIYDFKRNTESCRMIFKSSTRKECFFICHYCNHSFSNRPDHVEGLQYCSYCSPNNAKTLCPKNKNCNKCFLKSFASHPKSIHWDYSEGKNKGLTPHDVFKSGTHRADMLCEECKHPFSSLCNNISTGYWCPTCKKKTELKMKKFLPIIPLWDFRYQYNPLWLLDTKTNGRRSFDFADEKNKTSLEIDGDGHFYDIVHWGSTAKQNLDRDIQKMLLAVKQGFSGLRIYQIDVLFDKYYWHKWVINALKYIKSELEPIWVFPKNAQYESHIKECIVNDIRYVVL
jgi:hypothetical protein